MSDSTDLIQRWRDDGDERSAASLFKAHHAPVFRLAFGLLGDLEDAEEVAQDALTYALTHIDAFDPARGAFTTWLHVVTVSRCRNRRRTLRWPTLPLFGWGRSGRALAVTEPAYLPETHALGVAEQDEVWAAVSGLKPHLREAVVLRYWSGLSYRDISTIVGRPIPTVQGHVRQAFERLRSDLAPPLRQTLEKECAP